MTRTRASLLVLTFIWAGCGQPETQSGIGVNGGSIRSSDGRVTLEIPAGALSQLTAITIRELDNGSLPTGGVQNTGFELLPDGLTFARPVKLTLAYQAESLPGGDTAWLRVVQILDDGSIAFTDPASDPPKSGVATAMLHHFSKYAIADLKLANATITTTKKKITDVDVLFVVDNSNSMEEEQANLALNFPRFVQKLEQANLNYRIGVVSTDLGAGPYSIPTCQGSDGGKLRTQASSALPGCPLPKDPWIESKGGVTNVPGGNVTAAFSCIARLGVGGCGFEQPLESVHRALDPKLNINPGFLRPDAALVVVVITDEDDCSAKDTSLFDPTQQSLTSPLGPLTSFRCTEFGITCDVNGRTAGPRQGCKPSTGSYLHDLQRYLDLLGTLKPDGAVILSVIAGPASPVEVVLDGGINPSLKASCKSVNGSGFPAVRLTSLVQSFGKRGAITSVCDSDYGPALDMVGSLVTEQIQVTWCMPHEPGDMDPKTPEIEGACVVVASLAGQLPACKAGLQQPCYRLEKSVTCKASSTTISIENIAPASLGDEVQVLCLGTKPFAP